MKYENDSDYSDGYFAASQGRPVTDNPYAFVRHSLSLTEQRSRQAWNNGWSAYWDAADMNNGVRS